MMGTNGPGAPVGAGLAIYNQCSLMAARSSWGRRPKLPSGKLNLIDRNYLIYLTVMCWRASERNGPSPAHIASCAASPVRRCAARKFTGERSEGHVLSVQLGHCPRRPNFEHASGRRFPLKGLRKKAGLPEVRRKGLGGMRARADPRTGCSRHAPPPSSACEPRISQAP